MTDRKLSIDVTRCDGRITTNPPGFGTVSVGQAECVRCLRRTSPGRPEGQEFMEPPQFVAGRCSMLIDPESGGAAPLESWLNVYVTG